MIPKYSVIAISGNMQHNQVNGTKVLVFKEPPVLIRAGLSKALGDPKPLASNQAEPGLFEREVDITIPEAAVSPKKPS